MSDTLASQGDKLVEKLICIRNDLLYILTYLLFYHLFYLIKTRFIKQNFKLKLRTCWTDNAWRVLFSVSMISLAKTQSSSHVHSSSGADSISESCIAEESASRLSMDFISASSASPVAPKIPSSKRETVRCAVKLRINMCKSKSIKISQRIK